MFDNKRPIRSMSKMLFLSFIFMLAIEVPVFTLPAEWKVDEQEYKQQMDLIKSKVDTVRNEKINNLSEYKIFADEIQTRWKDRNPEYYARLMLEICKPISSGFFKDSSGNLRDNRSSEVAREYALSALKDVNEIPLELELQLTGHIMTMMYSSNAPKGEDFANHRKKDSEIRLHAWKRLVDAIDPNWDPNVVVYINVPLPKGATGVSGMSPKEIKDPTLRAEYEAAREKNRQNILKNSQQSSIRDWLKRYPKTAERYIIEIYSLPPYNNEELQQYLDRYLTDKTTKDRIMNAVKSNIEKAEKEKAK